MIIIHHTRLLNTIEIASMRLRQMQNLYTEIFKTLANMNLLYMWELFEILAHLATPQEDL